jgi:hypothetical protein
LLSKSEAARAASPEQSGAECQQPVVADSAPEPASPAAK